MNQADRYLDDQAEQERQQRAAAEQFQQPMGAYQQPVYQQPVYLQPVYLQPVYQQPAYVLQRMASMGEAWSNFWSRWTFAGRASRSEFWLMWVWGLLIGIAFWIVAIILAVLDLALVSLLFYGIFCLAVIIPSLCLQVRRLHDLGYSGWLWWLNFVPVGGIVLFIFFLLPSEPRPNRYGPVPFQVQQ